MKVGDLVRGSKDNIKIQQESVALIVAIEPDGRYTISWVGGEIKCSVPRTGFHSDELEVVSEGR